MKNNAIHRAIVMVKKERCILCNNAGDILVYKLFSSFIASAMPFLTCCLVSSLILCNGRLGKPP